jgi:hypothetical protein
MARSEKKPGPSTVPAVSWLVARIKIVQRAAGLRPVDGRERLSPHKSRRYAVLRGRIVKSRTCVRMLDICIPFSCDTNGRISAMN